MPRSQKKGTRSKEYSLRLMEIRVLSAAEVNSALPMSEAIVVIESAFAQYSTGKAAVPLRTHLDTRQGTTLIMPAYLEQSNDLAVKIVSVYEGNTEKGLPTISALVVAMDPHTGRPVALMDGESLTAIRTGAAGGVAAKHLSRRDASTVVLFGAGVQGRAQLRAVMCVREVKTVFVIDRDPQKAKTLAEEVKTWSNVPVVSVPDSQDQAVREADIVIAATTTRTPLFDGDLLKPGVHVTGIGSFTPEMQELDEKTVRRSVVVVDSREACKAEAGDIIKANVRIDAELGEVITGKHPGRNSDDQITFFKSVGLAAQDAAAAGAVLAKAREEALGTLISFG